jgi:hypothetical protein
MIDGVRSLGSLQVRDSSRLMMVELTPRASGTQEWIADVYCLFGFAAVGQDWRGTGLSEGTFSMFHGRYGRTKTLAQNGAHKVTVIDRVCTTQSDTT